MRKRRIEEARISRLGSVLASFKPALDVRRIIQHGKRYTDENGEEITISEINDWTAGGANRRVIIRRIISAEETPA